MPKLGAFSFAVFLSSSISVCETASSGSQFRRSSALRPRERSWVESQMSPAGSTLMRNSLDSGTQCRFRPRATWPRIENTLHVCMMSSSVMPLTAACETRCCAVSAIWRCFFVCNNFHLGETVPRRFSLHCRRIKKRRRYERLAATSQLSLW